MSGGDRMHEYEVTFTSSRTSTVRVLARNTDEAIRHAGEVVLLPEAQSRATGDGWRVDTIVEVPGRPPCTCPGLTDMLNCPRHGERARLGKLGMPFQRGGGDS